SPDLFTGGVDLRLSLGLPELVDPPDGVSGLIHRFGEIFQEGFQSLTSFGREPKAEHGVVLPKDTGEAHSGVAAPYVPGIHVAIFTEFLTLLQRHRNPFWMHKEAVFLQEPGEEHSVPVLVGALLFKPLIISELPSLRQEELSQILVPD